MNEIPDPRITVALVAITTLVELLRASRMIDLEPFLHQLAQAQTAMAMTGRLEESKALGEYTQALRAGCGDGPG